MVAGVAADFGKQTEVPEGTRITWSMGEGTELSGSRVTHAWHAPGSYQIQVKVEDPDGQQREDVARVEVTRPPLLQVLPADTEVLVLTDRPAERLRDFPLFLERLLVSGQDANAALTKMRDLVGFDPLDQKGLSAAGLDPEGGIAGVSRQLGGKTSFTIVYSISDAKLAQDTIIRIFSGTAKVEVASSKSDPAVTDIRGADKQELIAACMLYRGHLWVAPFEQDWADPLAVLAGLKTGNAAGLAGSVEYGSVVGSRKELGGLHLYVSRKLFQRVSTGRGVQEKLAGVLGNLRADLDFSSDGLIMDTFLGLSGPEISVLSGALQARNEVPDFSTLVGADQHLLAKFSVDLAGLAKALAEISGQADAWATLNAALEQLEKGSGIKARTGFLENLGDNYLVSVQIHPADVLLAASGPGGSPPHFDKIAKAVVYAQLKNPDLFIETLDSLAGFQPAKQFLRKVEGKHRKWTIGPAAQLTAAVGREFLVLATSTKLADAALQRIENPEKNSLGWPASMAQKDHQVLVFDVSRLINDLSGARVPQGNFGAEMARSVISMAKAKLGSLGSATLDAVLTQDALTVHLKLTLR